MRGRKPIPTIAKRLTGNPGKHPLNEQEPQPPRSAATFAVPAEIAADAIAVAYWNELAPMLREVRQITDADRGVMVALCVHWSRYIEATQVLQQRDEHGRSRMLIKLPNGMYVTNPYIGIANKAFDKCMKGWVELGLTPSARVRVMVSDPVGGGVDDFAEFNEPHDDRAHH